MGLHDRLQRQGDGGTVVALTPGNAGPARGAGSAHDRSVCGAEGQGPPRVHRQARTRALQGRRRGSRRQGLPGGHRGARPRPHAADARRAARDRPSADGRHSRLRPDRAAAPRRERDRNHGQRARTRCTSSGTASSSAPTSASSTTSHVMRIIDKIVSQVGRRVDESSPMVDARLPDGSRVNAIIPPLALRGPDGDDPEVLA